MSERYQNNPEGHLNIEQELLTSKQLMDTKIREAASFDENAESEAVKEFGVEEMRNQIAFLEKQTGHEIINSNLSLIQTITNSAKKRVTFYFELDRTKALELFGERICYNFMNEPDRKSPRYEVERVYFREDNIDDDNIRSAETIAKYEDGDWKTI